MTENQTQQVARPQITNRLGLPQAIVNAVANDPYDKGDADYSITGLLKPPRAVALERQYANEITEDASDRIWSLIGQVAHGILERSADKKACTEERLYMTILGKKIGGKYDDYHLQDDVLTDYKVTTVWKVKDGVPADWEAQQNGYVELFRQYGLNPKKSKVCAILRDWSKPESKRNSKYPELAVELLDVRIWDSATTIKFFEERVRLHEAAKTFLPQCSKEDRWAKEDAWAVKKKGAVRATRVYDEAKFPDPVERKAQAEAHAAKDESFEIEFRPGENTRCEHYCAVANFCSQFLSMKRGAN